MWLQPLDIKTTKITREDFEEVAKKLGCSVKRVQDRFNAYEQGGEDNGLDEAFRAIGIEILQEKKR